MTKFYFTAVSNSAKKKFSGSITTEDDKSARESLNKIGLAILSMSKEQPADWENVFEFSVVDKYNQEVGGEIIADDTEEVFDRLADELEIRKIVYICPSNSSEEEKLRAREDSVRNILEEKKKEEEQKTELEKRTLTGSLKSLVKLGDDKKPTKLDENIKKFSSEYTGDHAEKMATDFADQAQSDAAGVNKTNSADGSDSEAGPHKAKTTGSDEEPDWKTQLANIKDRLTHFFPDIVEKFSKFYFYATEIIMPPQGKTRKDGFREMWEFIFPPKAKVEIKAQIISEDKKALRRKAVLARFWIAFEEIIDLLAAVFIAYLGLGILSLYIEIPRVTALAEMTLHNNLTIHYFAGAFVFIRILLFLREKFTSWSFVRTSLLFVFGGLILLFAGINLL
ncbi:MAG: hypothetical protein V2A63_04910 [Patescibacteria group bacterium]